MNNWPVDGLAWRKSSFSTNGGSEGSCVEVADVVGGSMVRDTKNRSGAVLSFDTPAWLAFVTTAKSGDFTI